MKGERLTLVCWVGFNHINERLEYFSLKYWRKMFLEPVWLHFVLWHVFQSSFYLNLKRRLSFLPCYQRLKTEIILLISFMNFLHAYSCEVFCSCLNLKPSTAWLVAMNIDLILNCLNVSVSKKITDLLCRVYC